MAHCEEKEEKRNMSVRMPTENCEFKKIYCRKLFRFFGDGADDYHIDFCRKTENEGRQCDSHHEERSPDQRSRFRNQRDPQDLSNIMECVTGPSDVVKIRQDCCRILDEVFPEFLVKPLLTGSKAEGLDLPGSDTNFMYEVQDITVGQNTEDHADAHLLMVSNQSNACFVLLREVRNIFDGIDVILTQEINGMEFQSSFLVRMNCQYALSSSNFMSSSYQRPLLESNTSDPFDRVLCYKCPSWPASCNEWISRKRQFNWPSEFVKQKIVQFGVHIAPIGNPLSPQRDMEWRILFSLAERELTWSFTHVQMHCYAFLKIVLKEFIKPRFRQLSQDELPLCSYFLKTILFWAIEETRPSFWTLHNLTDCFRYLLCTLYTHVSSGHLSHYFIPSFNLFEMNVKGRAKQTLAKIMEFLLDLDIGDVFNICETLRKASINDSQLGKPLTRAYNQNIKDIWFMIRTILYMFNNESSLQFFLWYFSKADLQNQLHKVIVKGTISCLYYSNVSRMRCFANKTFYKILRTRSLKDIDYDLTSNKLRRATQYLLRKNFHTCLKIINDMFLNIPQKALYINCKGSVRNRAHGMGIFATAFCKEDIPNHNILSQEIILDIPFFKNDMNVVPAAIQVELARLNKPFCFPISPYVYAYYLMFLSYHGLSDVTGRHRALRLLLDAVYDRGTEVNFHSLNIGGHCLWLIGQYDAAVDYFLKSKEVTWNTEMEDSNSCYYYLSLLDVENVFSQTCT